LLVEAVLVAFHFIGLHVAAAVVPVHLEQAQDIQ
jgi:hypothetical protein